MWKKNPDSAYKRIPFTVAITVCSPLHSEVICFISGLWALATIRLHYNVYSMCLFVSNLVFWRKKFHGEITVDPFHCFCCFCLLPSLRSNERIDVSSHFFLLLKSKQWWPLYGRKWLKKKFARISHLDHVKRFENVGVLGRVRCAVKVENKMPYTLLKLNLIFFHFFFSLSHLILECNLCV